MGDLKMFREKFAAAFGSGREEIRVFFAPGRVNLIGEYTDFTGGYVFPAALTYGTWAAARPRVDGTFRLASTSYPEVVEVQVDDLVFRREHGWANYPKGVIKEFVELGLELSGGDILFDGNIPRGSGLSSSASIGLVMGITLNALSMQEIPFIELVKLAQQAENRFVGVNCGIMDQFAIGMGKAGDAILLKCDTLEYHYAPLALGDYRLVIINSNKERSLAESKYNERRRECEQGFQIIKEHLPDAACLGDVSVAQWEKVGRYVSLPTIYNRLEHVVQENARAVASAQALAAGDLHAFGQYMIQSHESLRDLFEVTGFALDSLFVEARKAPGCLGTRMTGAGFGGCTVSLVHKDALENFERQVAQGYQAKTGLKPTFYLAEIGDGIREIADV